NIPNENILDQLLLHVVPKGTNAFIEKEVIKFIINPDCVNSLNISILCYLGLLSHPYDALEYICKGLENKIACGQIENILDIGTVQNLANTFPNHRIAQLAKLLSGEKIDIDNKVENILGIKFPEDSIQKKLFLSIFDCSFYSPPKIKPISKLMESVISIRWSKYPTTEEFNEIDSFRKRYSALPVGVILDSFSRSIYMFTRENINIDFLYCLRMILFTGCVTPLSLMGPGGYDLLKKKFLFRNLSEREAENLISSNFSVPSMPREDRIWICEVNWRLSQLQFAGHLQAWASTAREAFPAWVYPRYLSGLDWGWLESVIEKIGMKPFVGNDNGIYIFFLKQAELFQRESVAFRIAIEPKARRISPETFCLWLFDTYDKNAIAIIRISLMAEVILKLRLADNYMAALTLRVTFLEEAVKRFGFIDHLLSEKDLMQEEEALNANISRMSVGSNQFEITWLTLQVDTNSQNKQIYESYILMNNTLHSSIASQKKKSNYLYDNGSSSEYNSFYSDWPLVMVICGIVNTFISHPTSGIESILSVRIRHDNFRREFSSAISILGRSYFAKVRGVMVDKLVKEFETKIYQEIQIWLDDKMHTKSIKHVNGVFDLIPNQEEMEALIRAVRPMDSLDGMIMVVFEWIKPKLTAQLKSVRENLTSKFSHMLSLRIEETENFLIDNGKDPEEVKSVSEAINSLVVRRARDLREWFKIPRERNSQKLKVIEIIIAVEQRFKMSINSGHLKISTLPLNIANSFIDPDHIRHFYDLISEIIHNCLKHAKKHPVRIRFTNIGNDIVASNLTHLGEDKLENITGHPYQTLHDTLFGEGKSGTKKIAYLSSSIIRKGVTINFIRRKFSYHVKMPKKVFGVIEERRK
ncbi:sensor histidine kinase, partial [Acetobacter orleanensis]